MIQVAKIGKSVGVQGAAKLHLLTDFPEIFMHDIVFTAKSSGLNPQNISLKIKSFCNGLVVFEGYESRESVKNLSNFILYASLEDTRKYCSLGEGEMFWFDVLGCEIVEGEEKLGDVVDIERIGEVDYLQIKAIKSMDLPKSFMIPYIDRYIIECRDRKIYTQGAKDIWLTS